MNLFQPITPCYTVTGSNVFLSGTEKNCKIQGQDNKVKHMVY